MNVTIREMKQDRWRLRIETKDDFGRRKFQYETVRGTKAVAEARREALARGATIKSDQSPETLELFMRAWIDDRLAYGHIVPSTAELYHRTIRPLYKLIGHKRVDDVTRRDVELAYRQLVQEFNPRRVKEIHIPLHKAFREAAEQGLIPVDPTAAVKAPKTPRAAKTTTFTPTQIATIVEASRTEQQLGLIVRFAIATGCRRGEICALRWEDVDLERGTIQIRQTAGVVGFKVVIGPTKTEGSARTIALPETMVQELRRHKAGAASPYVFPNSINNVQDPNAVSKLVREFFDRLGFPNFSMHDLRHAHATFLLQQKLPLKAVSRRLGHSDVRVTLGIYAHVMPGDDEQLAGSVNVFF